MKTIKTLSGALAVLTALPWAAYAHAQGAAGIEEKLESEYKLTKTNDDKTDIVTAGSVVVLHKDKVTMADASSTGSLCTNTYRYGRVTQSKACKVGTLKSWSKHIGHPVPGADNVPSTRSFVEGEKFWVTKIDVRDTDKERGVVFDFFTDAISDVRYKGVLTIPFRALTPTPDEALKLVAEVITVVPSDDAKDTGKAPAAPQGGQQETAPQTQAAAPPPPPAPAEPTAAPIALPPPPAPDSVDVSGQTIDQVVAEMGQPLQKFKAGAKEIYVYKNLKVTFVNGKAKDME